ncbi:MAG TPA: endonuclease/exonuclease/phosphatase family protein [Gaiellaceae bacterium]|nr:endonuclease/exonuclease/phosphatase family protein [Gaiellaceae bacterium]
MRVALSLVAVALLGSALGGAAGAGAVKKPPPRRTVTAMTRNLYLGAGLDPIVHATSIPAAFQAVADAWAQVQTNDFTVRARAIAGELARSKPDFVGLQELTLYRTQTPSDFLQTRATNVALDYELELRKTLKQRGLRYHFAGVDVNTDAELPSGNPPSMDIRLTVRNGLLVRNGIRVRHVQTANYQAQFPLFRGLEVAKRGWVSADATVGGRTFRVITTHLESFDRTTADAQARELLARPAKTRLPVILVGDLNSRPDGLTSQAYPILVAAGFRDAWATAYPNAPGLTCCHGTDLRDATKSFTERVDYVMTRGGFAPVRGAVTGEAPASRVAGLWPSDHGGVWMTLRLPKRSADYAAAQSP